MPTRLLVIDPDIALMVSIKQALENTGEFQVSVSANGLAAEDALRRRQHDLAVLGFDIPDMDSMELIALLRSIQPELPIIMCPATRAQQERVWYLDVQGAIHKPFSARDLIPYVRSVLVRSQKINPPQDESASPEMPPALLHLAQPQPSPTEMPDQAEAENVKPDATRILEEWEIFERGGSSESVETTLLEEDESLSATTALLEWQDSDQTAHLSETETLEDLMQATGWIRKGPATRPLPPPEGEPPIHPEDTPSVPITSLPGVQQFLLTSQQEDPTTFNEVLDAFAQVPPDDLQRSPDEEAFHNLIDSMRAGEAASPLPHTLEGLLSSIAAESATRHPEEKTSPSTENALDYVLETIRRGTSLLPPLGEPDRSEMDDATIGDVIEGLFDPSFEGVLAALAGKELPSEPWVEPTYSTPAQEGHFDTLAGDQYSFAELTADEDNPEWLDAYEATGIEPAHDQAVLEEPPISPEDSSHYPATAALTAVTGIEEGSEFSLDHLLSQIEEQLPIPKSRRPQLKPLPSWEKSSLTGTEEASQQLEALFDRIETPQEAAPPAPEPEPRFGDTRPSQAMLEELEGVPVQETDTSPVPSLDFGRELEPPLEQAPVDLSALFQPEEPAEETAEEMPEEMAPVDLPPVPEAPAYEEWQDQTESEAAPMLSIDDLFALADLPAEAVPHEVEAPQVPVDELEQERLVEVPVDTAARLLSGDYSGTLGEPEEQVAETAVKLTQFSLESSAQATMLARGGRLLARAGELPAEAMDRLFQAVDGAWNTSTVDAPSLIRFVSLPEAGEFLLYSTRVEEDLTLSMFFHANTPVRTIRRQARRLSESLEFVPELFEETPAAADESEASQTQPNRPTDLRPPEGLYQTISQTLDQPEPIPSDLVEPVRSRAEEPMIGYTCLWLPYDPGRELQGQFATDLSEWIQEIADENTWDLETLDVRPDYVFLSLSVPQKTLPDQVIAQLMEETARRAAICGLWANGYYVVTPPRALSDREIGRFITYQRQAQLG